MSRTARSSAPLLVCALIGLLGCRESAPSPPMTPMSSPIPERQLPPTRALEDIVEEPPQPALARVPEGPPAVRWSTPGQIRWRTSFDDAITSMVSSTLAGLAVSVGPRVHNVTSRGQDRWSFIAGKEHRVYEMGGDERVWSPEFGLITQLLRWGRKGWQRKWSAELVNDGSDGFLLVDAATVTAISPDGKDRWRASLEGLRRLEGPYQCGSSSLFHGLRGKEGLAITISQRGAVSRAIALERGSIVVGASPDCKPLVWNGSNLGLLDARGLYEWRHESPGVPMVVPMEGGYMLAHAGPGQPVVVDALTFSGEISWKTDLPLSGRVTRFSTDRPTLKPGFIAMCMDVSSPCARPEGNRGPYNALLVSSPGGGFTVLERHVQGHLNLAEHGTSGTIIASSSSDNVTVVTSRNNNEAVIWETNLEGRLSAGPYVGPDGEIYVATCNGWDCGKPFYLHSITGVEPEDEHTEDQ